MPMNDPSTALVFDYARLATPGAVVEVERLRLARLLALTPKPKAARKRRVAATTQKPRKTRAKTMSTTEPVGGGDGGGEGVSKAVRAPRVSKAATLATLEAAGLVLTDAQRAALGIHKRVKKAKAE